METELTANEIISILNNVSFGLVRTDKEGKILAGFSYSIYKLFDLSEDDQIEGTLFVDLLQLDSRSKLNFTTNFNNIFEDELFAELSAASINKAYQFKEKTIQLKATPISESTSMSIESVLFVIEDISKSMKKEKELNELRALLLISRNKGPLKNVVSEILNVVNNEENKDFNSEDFQTTLRALLHNWKGTLGYLSLDPFVAKIHSMEDLETVKQEHFVELATDIKNFLSTYKEVLNINFDKTQVSEFKVLSDELYELVENIKSEGSPSDQALKVIEGFVARVTMTKLGELLDGTEKMVHRMAKKLGKSVEIQIENSDMSVPLQYHEIIRHSVHIIRNAVYHGIESKESRVGCGKDETGHLTIQGLEDDRSWKYIISDDGKGIDTERVRSKVSSLKLIQDEKLNQMSENEVCNLIFLEGISTNEEADQYSGRGIGMANILSSVEDKKGKILISNEKGKGCKFEIILPKTA